MAIDQCYSIDWIKKNEQLALSNELVTWLYVYTFIT